MIYGNRSNQELKYAKARAKFTEYSVDASAQPRFPFDSDDLHYSSIHILSQYVDARLRGMKDKDFITDLEKTASFYDASANDGRNISFSDGYWTLAMATYFLVGNYGSAKVAACKVVDETYYGLNAALLVRLIKYLFEQASAPEELKVLSDYLIGGAADETSVLGEASKFMTDFSPEDSFFGRLLYVAIEDIVANSSRKLLPVYTGLDESTWEPYLRGRNAAKVLWQAQRAIGEAGVFKGESSFIQLPTGSGKTKSVELLIRSRVLAGNCAPVVVIAPLRALCAEIARDLAGSLGDVAKVELASDVMELDDWISAEQSGARVSVFTPEKFVFVLRHGGLSIDDIELFVFDEAHLLDSASRGPNYELLLTEIIAKRPSVQKVLMSAVVSNPEEIAEWAAGSSSHLTARDGIQVTEKSIALVNEDGGRISYESLSASVSEDFFLATGLRQQSLKLGRRESKERIFPDTSSRDRARDLAIYYANRLVKNGACAIFVPRAVMIRTFYNRLCDLDSRDAALTELKESYDYKEAAAITKLLKLHYGDEDDIGNGIADGVLPHYRGLQGAIRQSVEYAIEQGLFKCVVCTSTLAEGVNLPIKYLLITGVNNGLEDVRTRDFQNLIGRTARSGKYSEGSVVIVDKPSRRRGNEYLRLINPDKVEPCRSVFLRILKDVEGPRECQKKMSGADLVGRIMKNIDNPSLEDELVHEFESELGLNETQAQSAVRQRVRSLEAVESFIAGMYENGANKLDAAVICESTFAFSTATDVERKQLLELFSTVDELLEKKDARARRLCYITQSGFRKTASILEWIESDDGRAFFLGDCTDALALVSAFVNLDPNTCRPFIPEQIALALQLWVAGENLGTITKRINTEYPLDRKISVRQVESLVSDTIVFKLSNFIAEIIDALGEYPELNPSESCLESLDQLQRKVKYGVGDMRAALICEKVVSDRMIANKLVDIVGKDGPVDGLLVRWELLKHRAEVEGLIDGMPSYVRMRINRWLGYV